MTSKSKKSKHKHKPEVRFVFKRDSLSTMTVKYADESGELYYSIDWTNKYHGRLLEQRYGLRMLHGILQKNLNKNGGVKYATLYDKQSRKALWHYSTKINNWLNPQQWAEQAKKTKKSLLNGYVIFNSSTALEREEKGLPEKINIPSDPDKKTYQDAVQDLIEKSVNLQGVDKFHVFDCAKKFNTDEPYWKIGIIEKGKFHLLRQYDAIWEKKCLEIIELQ